MGRQEGVGIEHWPDGSKFKGNYLDGVKVGFGIQLWTDRSSYEGNWADN